jgi:hypothetical protein
VKLWQLIRDVILTGTAVFIIVTQVYSAHPDDPLLVVALALTTPALADHARALLSGPGGGLSSPPQAPPPVSQQAPSSEGASDDTPDPQAR